MAVFKNKRGKWVAQCWDAETSRNQHLGTFDYKADAQRAFQQAQGRSSSSITVGEFQERWMRDYPRPAASTNAHNHERTKRFGKAFAKKRVNRIDRRTARAWVLEHPSEHAALRAMFSDMLADDLIDTNPFSNLRINKRRPRRNLKPDWLHEQQVQELAATSLLVHQEIPGHLVRSMILVAAYTAVRPGELFALEVGDVRDGELIISKAAQSKTRTIGPPKNGKPRVIVLPDIARAAIEDRPVLHDRLVFPTPTGRQMWQSSWQALWNPVRNAVGRPNMHFYELRHWCATYLLEQGVSASNVAVQMGHANAQIVLDTYGHPSEDLARDRIRKAFEDAA